MKNNSVSAIPKEWLTHCEISGYEETPDYKNTISYFEKFTNETSFAKMFTFGISHQGRELKYLVVSSNKEFTPEKAKASGKAVVLIQNCIHPGEPEGKDASMMLLREILITKEKDHQLDNIILIVIPVFNVDGHERLSPYNRPNQNGPKRMGWRTNAVNLNLNRDYMKADSLEMKAWLQLFNSWLPDFMIDNHTTNGADYQYHVTYGLEKHVNMHHSLSTFVKESYLPYLKKNVEKDGFLTAPYVEFKNNNFSEGLIEWAALPRFSNGYCAVQNRVCLLVETHSLKPFENRVQSTISMNSHTLEFINKNSKKIKELNKKADDDNIRSYLKNKKPFPLVIKGGGVPSNFNFRGFKFEDVKSEITGSTVRKYSSEPFEYKIPHHNKVKVEETIIVPSAYVIPKEFENIIDILRLHGIDVLKCNKAKKIKTELYRFSEVNFWKKPYEGRMQVDFKTELFTSQAEVTEGDYLVLTNQRTLKIILNLLEPSAPDSFVRWGFFNAFFERKEYAEAYIMEPIARKMIKEDENLKKEFYRRLEDDENFRNSPDERIDFFYRNSPFYDQKEKVYPVLRSNDKSLKDLY